MRSVTSRAQRTSEPAAELPSSEPSAEPTSTRDKAGRFARGHRAQLQLLPGFDPQTAQPWIAPHLALADTRYRSFLKSGLMKGHFGLHGLLRTACTSEAVASALTAQAASLDFAQAQALLADAMAWGRESKAAWGKLRELVGTKRSKGSDADPMAELDRSIQRARGGDADDDEGDPNDHDDD